MKFHTTLFTLINIIILFPIVIFAADEAGGFIPLVGIPDAETNGSFESFINSLYYISIGIAALLAVIKIIIAGVKYMLSEIVTDKGTAKKEIKGALLGLLIVLAAVMILEFINPQLTNINYNPETVTSPTPNYTTSNTNRNVPVNLNERSTRIRSINEDSHNLIPSDQTVPQGKEEEWICKNVVTESCPYEAGVINRERLESGASTGFCYKGDWDSGSDSCSVSKSNEVLTGSNAAPSSNSNFDPDTYIDSYKRENTDIEIPE